MIYFEVIFFEECRSVSRFFSFFLHVNVLHRLLKRLCLPTVLLLFLCQSLDLLYGSISGFSIQLHLSICLFSH